MKSDTKFHRWWPAVVVFFVGWACAAGFAIFVGSQIHDHDTAVIAILVAGMFAGLPVGMAAVVAWMWRNP